jgi:heme-degrading monooxygenase HmoA
MRISRPSYPPPIGRVQGEAVDSGSAQPHNFGKDDARDEALVHEDGLTMICRIWHGWTAPGDADAYEALLKTEIMTGIRDRRIAGYRGIQLLRRGLADEVEFVTIMWFDSMDAVRTFAGEEYESAVVPPKARLLLSRFDERSQHYDVKAEMMD